MYSDRFRHAYRDATGINTKDKMKAALARAHEQRRFEIDNYWKRSTYLWAFQVVAFAAIAWMAQIDAAEFPILPFISAFGTVVSVSGVFMAKGSKFWKENWEAHIEILERDVEGSIYGVTLVKGDLGYSVSHINQRLLEAVAAGWGMVFAISFLVGMGAAPELASDSAPRIGAGAALLFLCLSMLWIRNGQKLRLPGRAFNDLTGEWETRADSARVWWPRRSRPAKYLVVRD